MLQKIVVILIFGSVMCKDQPDSYLSALRKSHDVDTLPGQLRAHVWNYTCVASEILIKKSMNRYQTRSWRLYYQSIRQQFNSIIQPIWISATKINSLRSTATGRIWSAATGRLWSTATGIWTSGTGTRIWCTGSLRTRKTYLRSTTGRISCSIIWTHVNWNKSTLIQCTIDTRLVMG